MAVSVRATDHKSDVRATSLQRAEARVEEFLQALARAVQQFHTYPAASSMCQNAIETCARALVVLENQDQVHLRVAPRDLIVDDTPVGRGTIVEQELARRLHAARVAEVTIERSVTPRELSRFCLDLIQCSGRAAGAADLLEMIGEHGVDRITLLPAYRPEVLSVGAPTDAVTALVEGERRRHEQLLATPGAAKHLYPPDKGWVRLDPSSRSESISLVELALLADDPSALAAMLMRLTDDGADGGDEADALSRRFSDVTMLFSALEPRVARAMFSKLARAVLALDPERRQALLRRTILPGLLDGRMDGSVLRDFPDVDLADSLCLLLDLETAAPEVVGTALARLDLPAERQAAVAPLIDARLQGRVEDAPRSVGLDAHARRLTTRRNGKAASFAELSAFDLALDADTAALLVDIRQRIVSPDTLEDRLDCLGRLIALEPNPDTVARLVDLATPLTWQLEADGRWDRLADRLHRYRHQAERLRESRPDVADLLFARLSDWCTVERAARLSELATADEGGRALAETIVRALGPAMGPALVAVAQARAKQNGDGPARGAIQLLCDCAAVVAPSLVAQMTQPGGGDRIVARVLGFAGPGYEQPLGAHLSSTDEQTVREALRGLARIGTGKAATLVCQHIGAQAPFAPAAEESLWRFPAAEAQRQARALLGRREFVLRHPAVAARLFDRAAHGTRSGWEPLLQSLSPLRLRIWNPPLARLGRKAKAMLTA